MEHASAGVVAQCAGDRGLWWAGELGPGVDFGGSCSVSAGVGTVVEKGARRYSKAVRVGLRDYVPSNRPQSSIGAVVDPGPRALPFDSPVA